MIQILPSLLSMSIGVENVHEPWARSKNERCIWVKFLVVYCPGVAGCLTVMGGFTTMVFVLVLLVGGRELSARVGSRLERFKKIKPRNT